MNCFIYALIVDDTIFYVGQTSRGAAEPEAYLVYGGKPSQVGRLVHREIFRAKRDNKKLTWEILESCSVDELNDLEKFWIANFRAAGAILTNMTDGGEDGLRGRKLSPEHRAKIAAGNTGKKFSEERKRNIGLKSLGRRFPNRKRKPPRAPKPPGRIGRPPSPRLMVTCSWCGKSDFVPPGHHRFRSKRNYCNLNCMNEHRRTVGWKYA